MIQLPDSYSRKLNPYKHISGSEGVKHSFGKVSFGSSVLETDKVCISFKGYDLDADNDWQKLKSLAEKVKFSKDKKLKRELWEQERLILEQELSHPEKYLERVKRTGGMEDIPDKPEAQVNQVRINSLKGLITYYIALRDMDQERFTDPKFYYPQFEKIIKDIPDDAPLAEELQTWALHLSSAMYKDLNEVYQNKAEELALYAIENSPFEQSRTIALNLFGDHVDKSKPTVLKAQKIFLEKFNSQGLTDSERNLSLIALGKLEAEELKEIIPKLLTSDAVDDDSILKTITVWCAGRVRSKENFDLLVRVINETIKKDPELKNEENFRITEMALASIVEYNKVYPERVKNILQALSKDNSPLNIVAVSLLEQFENKHIIPEFFIQKDISSPAEQQEFKNLRGSYVEGINLLNEEQKNWLDRGLLPFRKFLDFFKFVKAKLIISEDTATGSDIKLTGKRTGDGRFWDLVTGAANDDQAVVTTCDFKKPFSCKAHVSGHEMAHQILKYLKKFDKDEYKELERIFGKAKAENRCLDLYAASDIEEFWAVGYEVYLLHYKSHKSLIDFAEKEVGTANTRSVLKRRDLEFYNFIEHIINKYGLSETGVQKAKDEYTRDKKRVIRIEVKAG